MKISKDKVECMLCHMKVHSIEHHLANEHPGLMTLGEYEAKFPDAPIMTEAFDRALQKKLAEKEAAAKAEREAAASISMAAPAATVTPLHKTGVSRVAMHELFKLGAIKEALNGKGEPIPITVFEGTAHSEFVPAVDENHVFDVELLKNCLMAIELGIPLYAWGHKGSGKTTTLEQIFARTNRPMMRVQHTINTEESHIIGQWVVRGGETIFQPGPLPMAMRYGWAYLADEYDFMLPSALSVYQPVLEGKPLVIKEAQGTEWGIVKPHPAFRFAATGNTNGSGDETGLYQGTQIQNSANYDRFGVVVKVNYMKPELERKILVAQAKIIEEDAELLVKFATHIREAYDGAKMSDTISPRTLINAARLGVRRGSFRLALALAFMNKLNKVDREVADGIAVRVFGS